MVLSLNSVNSELDSKLSSRMSVKVSLSYLIKPLNPTNIETWLHCQNCNSHRFSRRSPDTGLASGNSERAFIVSNSSSSSSSRINVSESRRTSARDFYLLSLLKSRSINLTPFKSAVPCTLDLMIVRKFCFIHSFPNAFS